MIEEQKSKHNIKLKRILNFTFSPIAAQHKRYDSVDLLLYDQVWNYLRTVSCKTFYPLLIYPLDLLWFYLPFLSWWLVYCSNFVSQDEESMRFFSPFSTHWDLDLRVTPLRFPSRNFQAQISFRGYHQALFYSLQCLNLLCYEVVRISCLVPAHMHAFVSSFWYDTK